MPDPNPRTPRRKLLYIAGFDPGGPRRYHAIYTAEAARQAAVTGVPIAVGPLEKRGDGAERTDVTGLDHYLLLLAANSGAGFTGPLALRYSK